MASWEKVFDHVSDKGNNVFRYDIVDDGSVIASVFSRNVAEMFVKAVNVMNSDLDYQHKSLVMIAFLHLVHHDDKKLEGLSSFSSSCLHNPICLERMKTNSICAFCYAGSQQAMQHGLDDHNALNGYILQRFLFDSSVMRYMTIKAYEEYNRIESFGDVANVTQARNYIRYIKAFPEKYFAIWSKNLAIWAKTFEIEGKPDNTTFVQSSLQVDKRDQKKFWFVDHVFTVWSSVEVARQNGVEITCGGRKCIACLRCYHDNTGLYVDELKK